MIPNNIPREYPERKRRREQEFLDARKSLRTDLFHSKPGGDPGAARTQTADEVYHSSRDVGKDMLRNGSGSQFRRHNPVQERRQTHTSQQPVQASSSDDEIQMTGWRHNPTIFPKIARRVPTRSQVSKSRAEVIFVSSDEKGECLDEEPFEQGLKRKRFPVPSQINTTTDGSQMQTIRSYMKRVKQCKPPENNTKHDPILILDSSDEETKCESPGQASDLESDSDYDSFHGGYDINWTTSPPDPDTAELNDDVDFINAAVAKLSLNRVKVHLPSGSRLSQTRLNHSWESSFVYRGPPSFLPPVRLRRTGPLQTSYSGGRSRTGLLRHRPLQLQTPLTRLKRLSGFHMADACLSISQSAGKLLVASATPGGTMEEEGEDEFVIDPYNAQETLALWTEAQFNKWIPAHYVNSNDPGGFGGPFQRKFYDVKCACFDPRNPNLFASTGLDGVLTVWNLLNDDKELRVRRRGLSGVDGPQEAPSPRYDPVKKWGKETYNAGNCCLDIIYRPHNLGGDRTLFAAPSQDGRLFIHSYTDSLDRASRFHVRPSRIDERLHHKIGATVWGHGPTSNDIFVCSEEPETYTLHGAINVDSGKSIYHFDDNRSGEELALSPEGGTLALFTAEEENLHLRLYDVRRGDSRHTSAVNLPPSSFQLPDDAYPEVRTAKWSPDGIFLAVGKNDDVVDVYDVRGLGRGPVLSMRHKTHRSFYGITVLEWTTETGLRTPNLGLLTGGGDHCIALWDVRTACEERQVLAELDGKVSVGNFGDFTKGEKPLVAGDIDGHVYIYDFVDKRTGMDLNMLYQDI